jgi:hypothetical protein
VSERPDCVGSFYRGPSPVACLSEEIQKGRVNPRPEPTMCSAVISEVYLSLSVPVAAGGLSLSTVVRSRRPALQSSRRTTSAFTTSAKTTIRAAHAITYVSCRLGSASLESSHPIADPTTHARTRAAIK